MLGSKLRPKVPSSLLVSGKQDVAAWPGSKVAHDGRFNIYSLLHVAIIAVSGF